MRIGDSLSERGHVEKLDQDQLLSNSVGVAWAVGSGLAGEDCFGGIVMDSFFLDQIQMIFPRW